MKRSRDTCRTSRSTTRRRARCRRWASTSTRAPTPASRHVRPCMAFTHGDTFKPIPGYKTFVNHFHLDFTGRQRASRIARHAVPGPDRDAGARPERHRPERLPFRAARQRPRAAAACRDRRTTSRPRGAHPTRTSSSCRGKSRARTSAATTTSCGRRTSTGPRCGSRDSRSSRTCRATARSTTPAAPRTCRQMMDAEGAYWYHAHPRTKSTTGYPDLIFDKPYVEERSLPGRGVQARHGPGQLGSADVRLALLRRHRHDEQHVRGPRHAAEVSHRRHRHVSKGPGGRPLRRTSRSTT